MDAKPVNRRIENRLHNFMPINKLIRQNVYLIVRKQLFAERTTIRSVRITWDIAKGSPAVKVLNAGRIMGIDGYDQLGGPYICNIGTVIDNGHTINWSNSANYFRF